MTHAQAIRTVRESLINVMAGRAVYVEDNGPLYGALLLLTDEDAQRERSKRTRTRYAKEPRQRGYHDDDGWSVRVR